MKFALYAFMTCVYWVGFSVSVKAETEPDFMKHYFLDAQLSELKAKYKTSLQKISCKQDITKMCSGKCDCYNVTLSSSQVLNKNLLFVTSREKVVLTIDKTQTEPRFYSTYLETVSRWFEESKPTSIYEVDSVQYGHQGFLLMWQLNGGYISSSVACPVSNNNRKILYQGLIRECKVRAVKMSRIDKFIPPADLKLSQLKY